MDLLVLDPTIPGLNPWTVYNLLQKKYPNLAIVIHQLPGHAPDLSLFEGAIVVDKEGRSIDDIKKVIHSFEKP